VIFTIEDAPTAVPPDFAVNQPKNVNPGRTGTGNNPYAWSYVTVILPGATTVLVCVLNFTVYCFAVQCADNVIPDATESFVVAVTFEDGT